MSVEQLESIHNIGDVYAAKLLEQYGTLEGVYAALDDGDLGEKFPADVVNALEKGRSQIYDAEEKSSDPETAEEEISEEESSEEETPEPAAETEEPASEAETEDTPPAETIEEESSEEETPEPAAETEESAPPETDAEDTPPDTPPAEVSAEEESGIPPSKVILQQISSEDTNSVEFVFCLDRPCQRHIIATARVTQDKEGFFFKILRYLSMSRIGRKEYLVHRLIHPGELKSASFLVLKGLDSRLYATFEEVS